MKLNLLFSPQSFLLISVVSQLFIPKPIQGQEQRSYYGNAHTPKGNLHVLMIFVRYSNTSRMKSSKWPDVTEDGVLPKMAQGEINDLFNSDPYTIGKEPYRQNLSDYYYKMSGGTFKLTGDIFPIQVPVTYIRESRTNFFRRQSQMNEEAIEWIAEHYPNFDWAKYDRRKNTPNFRQDNSESSPDGVIDYVVFMHREKGSNGASSPGTMKIPGTNFRIKDGHTGIKSYDDASHSWLYFKHEFAHNLYNCPHYLGANSANGQHLYTQKGWGMMSAWHAPFFTANAWESWWMGWLEPQLIKQSGTYQLKDYLTGRDAIRIQVPGTQDYLWIENHQKKDPFWDRKQFFNKQKAKGEGPSGEGIYAYVVASPGSDRLRPRLNPYSVQHSNIIKMYNGEGNFDITSTEKKAHNGFFDVLVMQKKKSNPFSGQNDFQFILDDFNRNGKIEIKPSHGNLDKGSGEQKGVWAELIDSTPKLTFGNTGDANDAFKVGDELGLSGIVPVTNYPKYDHRRQQMQPYIINGITIRLLEVDQAGTYTLTIQLDDWDLRSNQRWCGNLQLPSLNYTSESARKDFLNIQKRVNLTLDLSGTANRSTPHPETGTFANPTTVVVEKGRGIHIDKRASLDIKENSALILKSGAEMVVEKKARLNVWGRIKLEPGAKLLVKRRAVFTLAEEAEFEVNGDPSNQVLIQGTFRDNREKPELGIPQ